MMKSAMSSAALAVLLLGALLAGGCGHTKASHFYLLSAMEAPAAQAERGVQPSLEIGPVNFPEHLDRPQIVLRTSPNTIELAEFDRWAEPLAHNAARVVAENLSQLMNTDQVVLFPGKHSPYPTYQIQIDIQRMEGTLAGPVVMSATWIVRAGNGNPLMGAKHADFHSDTAPGSYEALAAQYSSMLAELSKQIADSLEQYLAEKRDQ